MKNLLPALLVALAAWSSAVRAVRASEAATTAHPDFEVTVTGQGRPVVFIPGLGTPGSIWDPAVDHLKTTCQCHVITVAGFGGTWSTATDPLLPRLRDEIIAYLRANHIESPVIVGHSFGGVMAMKIAITAPDLPGRLVLVDSTPFLGAILNPGVSIEEVRAQFAEKSARIGKMSPEQFAAYQQSIMLQWVGSPENAKRVATENGKSDPKTVARAMKEAMSMDLRADLVKITCPTLVLGALADKTEYESREMIVKTLHDQFALLKGVRFQMFDHAKHFIMVDDPAGFQKALDDELALK